MINDTKEKITEFLFINKDFKDLKKYDLVIILGNNFYKQTANLLKELVDNKNINNETLVIISGNKGTLNKELVSTEAELITKYIDKLDIKLNYKLEKQATNIKENLLYSKEMVGDLTQYSRILFIGKSFAARRMLMCADALNYPIEKIDILGVEEDIRGCDWYSNRKAKKRVLEELVRISKYTINNDLKI